MKVERCSYDVMTPSAARGMLEAIYWHPGMRWVIDKIYVRKPIQFTSIRRNEVKSKVLAGNVLSAINGGGKPLYISSREEIVQRAAILLRDVEYVVEAHFEMTPKAVPGIMRVSLRTLLCALRRGECYHQPYFGCREFPARFALYEEEEVDTAYDGTERDLGYMLYDLDYSDTEHIKPMFFRLS